MAEKSTKMTKHSQRGISSGNIGVEVRIGVLLQMCKSYKSPFSACPWLRSVCSRWPSSFRACVCCDGVECFQARLRDTLQLFGSVIYLINGTTTEPFLVKAHVNEHSWESVFEKARSLFRASLVLPFAKGYFSLCCHSDRVFKCISEIHQQPLNSRKLD